MVRSMVAGVAGLKAHQSKMDVIGNNIANVNTWGFKGFSYNFSDAMYTNSIKSTGGNIEAGAEGGRNASQVGYGSQMSSISNVFENGTPSPSSNPMDCMIDGTGFFLVGKMVNGSFTNIQDSGLNLSRVGIFRVDDNKYLVDDQRSYVYGYALMEGTGVPETPAQPASSKIEGVPFSHVAVKGNDGTVTGYKIKIAGVEVETNESDVKKAIQDWVSKALTNTQFNGYTIAYNGMTHEKLLADENDTKYYNYPSFTITSNSTGSSTTQGVRDMQEIFLNNGGSAGNAPDGNTATSVDHTENGQTYKVDPNARPLGPTVKTPEVTEGVDYIASIPAEYADELSTLQIPIDPATGARYKLDNYSINENGVIVGVDESNRTIVIGQLALIQVQNPNGLEKTVGYYYQIGDNAGEVDAVKPGTGPAGKVKPSYLEMANVDLANEFSNIITTQRGFQANSKIITVTDEMLQELVNMKR